ncbi:MAG TPA: DUF2461 domain-containing protein [Nocardioidaceae bacterium]|nr:DUF2461 domain-containing protein [Nocardioidaceae bacterium]
MAEEFTGFPVAALDFYDDLEMDNTKSFWTAHKNVYDSAVKAPMLALCAALEMEFGPAKVFRPYRDMRFAGSGRAKAPYKTHQGAFVGVAAATGYYIQIGAPGVRVGGGFYHAESADLARIRAAIDDERTGRELEKLLAKLSRAGLEVGGEQLKRPPRGFDADHPRVELLKHKSLTAGRDYGFEDVIHTSELLALVRRDWRWMRPLVEWISDRIGETPA